jgi:hypothetical protein
MTVRLNGIVDGGPDCDLCSVLNQDYTVELFYNNGWMCRWNGDYDDVRPGVHSYIELTIAWTGPGDDYFYIEVAFYTTIDDCPDLLPNYHIIWYHRQNTPYDCPNLDVVVPFERAGEPWQTGCTGGTARVMS